MHHIDYTLLSDLKGKSILDKEDLHQQAVEHFGAENVAEMERLSKEPPLDEDNALNERLKGHGIDPDELDEDNPYTAWMRES